MLKIGAPSSKLEVEVDRNKQENSALKLWWMCRNKTFRAEETSESVEASADVVIDDMATDYRDKDREGSLTRRGAQHQKNSRWMKAPFRNFLSMNHLWNIRCSLPSGARTVVYRLETR